MVQVAIARTSDRGPRTMYFQGSGNMIGTVTVSNREGRNRLPGFETFQRSPPTVCRTNHRPTGGLIDGIAPRLRSLCAKLCVFR